MRRSFKLEDLDCANCAAKMEEAIGKLPGVTKVSVNFMAQKKILEADDDAFVQILSLRTINKALAKDTEEAEACKDAIKLYMGEKESITHDGQVLATWKTGARGRTFRLKDKIIDDIINNEEDGN